MILDDVLIGCRTSTLQRPSSLNPASPLPESLVAASSWGPLLPKLSYDHQGRYFQRMSPCSCTTKGFLLSLHLSPVYPWFEHSTIFLGRHASGNFRHVHLQSSWFGRCVPLLQPSHSHSCREPCLQDIKQSWADFFKSCFHSSSGHISLSFLFEIQEFKTLWKGNKGKYLAFFLFLLFFHLVWETWPCGYSQDEMYSPVPCQLLMVSDSPVSSTAAVNSRTLLAVALPPCLLGQRVTTEPHGHAWALSHSPDDN